MVLIGSAIAMRRRRRMWLMMMMANEYENDQ